MDSKTQPLIAFNFLKDKIIDTGLCTLCGACETACPMGVLHLKADKVDRLSDCSQGLDLCPICYEICPHSEALLLRSLSFVADAPIKNEAIGYYRKIVLAQACDSQLRIQSHGGAVVTSLLKYGIESGFFDSAIVSQGEIQNPSKPLPAVAVVPDDILAAIGSKFFPSSVAKAYGSAVYGYGKRDIAFVGVPCHVLAVRKLEAWQHKISSNLKIIFGLFCFGTFSMNSMLDHISKKYKLLSSDILRMRLSSSFVIQTRNGDVKIPLSEIDDHILPSCRVCADFTSELADISIGSGYPLEGWSTIIIRTKIGEDFFYDAVSKGIVNTWVIEEEPKVFERLIVAGMEKRNNALKKAKQMEQNSGHHPVLLLRESSILANSKVSEVMTPSIKTVSQDITVTDFLALVPKYKHIAYPLVNKKNVPIGWITLEEAAKVEKQFRSTTIVNKIAIRKLITVYPDETALSAFKKMSSHKIGRVLVIDRNDSEKILGLVTKTDLIHALTKQF